MKTLNLNLVRVSVFITILFLGSINIAHAQDTIIKVNGEKIFSQILEISNAEIKYKRTDNLAGPSYSIGRSDVKSIHYHNGSSENFNILVVEKTDDYPAKKNYTVDYNPNYILTLVDGTKLKGKLTLDNTKEVTIIDNNLGERTIQRKRISNLKREYGDEIYVVKMKDGSIVTGKILNQTEEYIAIEHKELGNIPIDKSKVAEVREFDRASINNQGQIWFRNPNCTRYLFAPSAFQLKRGEGYYQNIYGIGNAVNYGITDHFTLGGGLTGPFGIYLNAKAGYEIAPYLNVAAGVLLGNSLIRFSDQNYGMFLGFTALTVGSLDHNLTFSVGYGTNNNNGFSWMEKPVYVLNGMVRVGKKFALTSENWMINIPNGTWLSDNKITQTGKQYQVFYSYAFRYMVQRTTLDAGFINTPTIFRTGWYIGIPYIGFAMRFGNIKED